MIEIYEARRGLALRKQWRWRIRATNGRIVANGGEGYNNRADLLRGQKPLNAADARALPTTCAKSRQIPTQ